jgi:hypothetical protein
MPPHHGPRTDGSFCHCNQAICPLDTGGVHLDVAIVQEAYQATPALKTLADRLGNGAPLRHDRRAGLVARPSGSRPRGAPASAERTGTWDLMPGILGTEENAEAPDGIEPRSGPYRRGCGRGECAQRACTDRGVLQRSGRKG